MLRTLALAALVLALAPARAQTPDPTDPARYYPLDVGNVWEYDETFPLGNGAGRVEITADTVIAGVSYVIESSRLLQGDGRLGPPYRATIRFDPTTSQILSRFDSGEEVVWHFGGCPLGAAFGTVAQCTNGPSEVRGGLRTRFTFGDSTQTEVVALKSFGYFAYTYAADIGFVRSVDPIEGGEMRLRYARIRGLEYGTPMAVAAEPPPAPAGLALRSAGRTLVLSARDAGPVRLDLFDALGRRVASVFEGALGTGERRFSLPAVAPGLYVAQAIQGASRASVRVVVVR